MGLNATKMHFNQQFKKIIQKVFYEKINLFKAKMYAGKWIKKLIINNKNNFFKMFILFQEGKRQMQTNIVNQRKTEPLFFQSRYLNYLSNYFIT